MLDRPIKPTLDTWSPRLLDPPANDIQASLRDVLHKFAADVMRPVGRALDRMTPEEVVAPGSPFYAMHEKYRAFGISQAAMAELPPPDAALLQSMAYEELGWGDSGLAISIGVNGMPASVALERASLSASGLGAETARPEQPCPSSHLQWRTNRSVSGERSLRKGVTTGDRTPVMRWAAGMGLCS